MSGGLGSPLPGACSHLFSACQHCSSFWMEIHNEYCNSYGTVCVLCGFVEARHSGFDLTMLFYTQIKTLFRLRIAHIQITKAGIEY